MCLIQSLESIWNVTLNSYIWLARVLNEKKFTFEQTNAKMSKLFNYLSYSFKSNVTSISGSLAAGAFDKAIILLLIPGFKKYFGWKKPK